MFKLAVEPGEYACEWHIDGTPHNGKLYLRAGKVPLGEVFNMNSPEIIGVNYKSWAPSDEKHPEIYGVMLNGQDFVILNATLSRFMPDRGYVSGSSALCGHDLIRTGLRFPTVSFQIGGLTSLSGTYPVKSTNFPRRENGEPDQYSMTWNVESTQTWSIGDDKVTLHYQSFDRLFDPYHFSITTAPLVTISGPERTIEEWRLEYVEPLRDISSMALMEYQPINWIMASRSTVEIAPDGREWPRTVTVQEFSPKITQEPYLAVQPDRLAAPLLGFGVYGSSLNEVIAKYKTAAKGFQLFFELYIAVVRESLSPRAQYLTIMPALESLHSTKYGTGMHPVEEHRSKKVELIEWVRANHLDGKSIRWLKRWINGRGDYSLSERLERLFLDLDEDLRAKIQGQISPMPDSIRSLSKSASNVWDVLGHVRNDLAHGGASRSDAEIGPALLLVKTIATACLIDLLGAEAKLLVQLIDRDVWPVV